MVDDKYLVIGLKSTGVNANNGGLAFADITAKNVIWKTFGKNLNLSVDSIATERIKKSDRTAIAAVITTDKGYLFFGDNGEILEPVPNKGYLVDHNFVQNHRAESDDYEKARDGFLKDRFLDPGVNGYKGAAQDKFANWYLAIKGKTSDENGVFELTITTSQVEFPMPLELPY
jgi:hypothetical protein